MFKNIVKVAALAAVLGFAGVASAGPITGGSSASATKVAAKAQAKAAKAQAKAAKKALKAYNKCLKRARKGKVSASSCRNPNASYSLAAPTVAAAAVVAPTGPSCTVNCAQPVSENGPSTGQATEVPEPATLALIGISLLGMGIAARRRRKKA